RSENVVETALRQTALQGHLAAFKAGLLDAGAGLLALVAVTGGLAVAGTGAAALAGHGLPGAGGRVQFMKFHACTSLRYALVTTTRWEILAILPWVAALSGCSVTSPGRRSPRECATAICSLPRPIRLLARRMVTFSIVVPSLTQDLGNSLAALGRDALGVGQAAQTCEGGSGDVDGVVGTQALGADVLDAGALEHRTDGTAGQNAGTGGSGTHQDAAGAELTHDLVGDGAALHGDLVHVLLGSAFAL